MRETAEAELLPPSSDETGVIDAEREAIATEVAELFAKTFGGPDRAEHTVRSMLLDCRMIDDAFWDGVITALAQIRG